MCAFYLGYFRYLCSRISPAEARCGFRGGMRRHIGSVTYAHLDCLELRKFHWSVKNEATVDSYVDM